MSETSQTDHSEVVADFRSSIEAGDIGKAVTQAESIVSSIDELHLPQLYSLRDILEAHPNYPL